MVEEKAAIAEISRVRRSWSAQQTRDYIAMLPLWNGKVDVEQHFGGLQNRTYFATTPDGRKYAVRTGFDQARTRQTSVVQCTIAAHTLGLGPRLVHAEPNLTVVEFVDGKGMTLEQMKDPGIMRMVVDRMKILHEGAGALQETISYWWPFDTVRRYLKWMETGRAATGFRPSRWAYRVPELRDITDRLEKVIAPYIPKFTHNDMAFVNMILNPRGGLMFIDWDGGAYGHPMWDLAEMLMWAEADEVITRKAVLQYHGPLGTGEFEQKIREVRAFQIMAAIRLITECMDVILDPYFYLTPEEQTESMKAILPGQNASLDGLIELLVPRFELLWGQYKHEFGG
jgi:thiamine kinase-like enzyme